MDITFAKDPEVLDLVVERWRALGTLSIQKLKDKGVNYLERLPSKSIVVNSGRKGPAHYYFGQVNSIGKPHGIGRLVMKGSALYEGEFHNGLREGWGRLIFFNGSYYEGHFSENSFCGEGSLLIQPKTLRMRQDADELRRAISV